MSVAERETTGLPGLDEILDGLRNGDNVVWSVDEVADYRLFVTAFVREALAREKKVVYLRFARHEPLVEPAAGVTVCELDAYRGFESFTSRIHEIITREGRGVFYVFDCLSNLLSAWATDLMIGNFFRVTCPYLFELDTVAYFSLLRGSHSFKTIERIRETTQLLLEVFSSGGALHIQPVKVLDRNSPTMFLPHLMREGRFEPVADSWSATSLLATLRRNKSSSARRQLDYWHRLFLQAEDLAAGGPSPQTEREMVDQLCRVMIAREERMLSLARARFSLDDLLEIKSRLIGTGFIGGKAVGMLLARKILQDDPAFDWRPCLEPHDSFHVGSDVFYSYIVHNGWWRDLMRQKTREEYFTAAAELREKMLGGSFPEEVREEFRKMLEYFGQYPIIVRSSSLLEDAFGNAFAGKYLSFFRVNQGTPEQRCEQFEEVVRSIFASTLSEDALAYRLQRGLDRQEEQMALLVQRVSGSYRGRFYFPELAGVGVSYNTFVWSRDLDPRAGMLRLVLGLGTRAVEREEDDYARIVALDAPLKRPYSGLEQSRRFSQREADLLDIEENRFRSLPLRDLLRENPGLSIEFYGEKDPEARRRLEERGLRGEDSWVLTFDRLLSESPLVGLMQRMLKTLERAYDYPVDLEFTVNFGPERSPRINLVQCRPLQTRGEGGRIELPEGLEPERVFIRSGGNFMGGSISQPVRRIISVDPEAYSRLPLSQKYDIARLVGRLNKNYISRSACPTLLIGPGRWGTSTPALGVPVTFSEINHVAVLAEVSFDSGGLIPELSFGTHFFQDLVETGIFYLALFPGQGGDFLDRKWLESQPNLLAEFLPSGSGYSGVVRLCDPPGEGLQLMADVVPRRLICFRH